jgi:hypothetical protein
MGGKFSPAYFKPSSALNPELQELHAANIFSVVRQMVQIKSAPGRY